MSSLDKLGIRGIRSFDNKEFNVIQFFHPLTVIVGHNGSGKTTIIECLKYITTGDMPPNTKGGAFVHDPNMAGESEVKAEVKLRFINTNGDRMVADRRLQVTKKKTTLSLKTLEGTISFDDGTDDTKRRSISTKCSDMDDEIPRLLGVSKAILENVIFCHQEESNWPLSEPGVLKKKFDDIFEATKYTKALDQIKSIRKEQTAELKVDKERLLSYKTDRERAAKLESSIQRLEKDIVSKSAQSDQLDEVIREVTAHNKKFYELAVEHTRILSEVENLRIRKEEKERTMEDLRRTITELPGTKQELVTKRDNFARDAEEKRLKKRGYGQDLDTVEDEYQQTRKRVDRQATERGRLQGEEQRYEQALDDRQSTVTSLAGQHDIKGYDIDNLEEAKVDEFQSRLSSEAQKRRRALAELVEAGSKAADEFRSKIGSMESDQRTNNALRQDMRTQIQASDKRINDLATRIANARSSEAEVANLKQSISDSEKKRQTLVDESKREDLGEQLRLKGQAVKEAEGKRDQLHAELASLNRQADTRAKLAIKRAEVTKGETSIKNMIESSAASYRQLIDGEPTQDRMLAAVKEQISAKNGDLVRAERAAAAAQRDLTSVETSMSAAKSQKAKAEQEAHTKQKHIDGELENGQTLVDGIAEAETEIKTREKAIEQLNASKLFYERIISIGKNKHICSACNRGLDEDYLPTFERHCLKQIADTPAKIETESSDLPEWEKILSGLRKLEPDAARIKTLRDVDIPRMEEELRRIEVRHTNVTAKAEEASQILSRLKSDIRELESLRTSALDVERILGEMRDANRDVQDLERQLQSTGSSRTADDVQAELKTVAEKIAGLKSEAEQLSYDRTERQERLRAFDNEISRAQLKLKDAETQANVKVQAQEAKTAIETEKAALQERLDIIEKTIKEAEPSLLRLRRELQDLLNKQREKEVQASSEADAFTASCDQLKRAMDDVKRYKQANTKSNLRSCEAKIRELEALMKEQQGRMNDLRDAMTAIDKEENDSKNLERNVQDNIKYRECKEDVKRLEEEIAGKDIEGANKAKRQFDKDYDASRRKLQEYQAEHAKVGGELAMSESTLKEKKSELGSEYKDIRKLYTRQLIKCKTAEFACQDLEKYGKALDNAIMKYHSHKMMEINDTAQALWNKCYQGTDIDTIMIKSDNDNATKAGNRSYNYRVVMVKDQVEMDMRGRCSAGQKVLASIIIRLSLAESFGTNCGILALDEPTTNLDRDNIAALASALADIIKERRQQSNFQLIVITHDEDFLTALGASGALEKYWRVSRNHKQKSTIERQRLDQH